MMKKDSPAKAASPSDKEQEFLGAADAPPSNDTKPLGAAKKPSESLLVEEQTSPEPKTDSSTPAKSDKTAERGTSAEPDNPEEPEEPMEPPTQAQEPSALASDATADDSADGLEVDPENLPDASFTSPFEQPTELRPLVEIPDTHDETQSRSAVAADTHATPDTDTAPDTADAASAQAVNESPDADKTQPRPQNAEAAATRSPGSSAPAQAKKRMSKVGIGLIVLVILALVVAGGLIIKNIYFPDLVSEKEVLHNFNAEELTAGNLTSSIYADNTGYKLSQARVLSVRKDTPNQVFFQVEALYKNASFVVVVRGTQAYYRYNSSWKPMPRSIDSVVARPLAPPNSQALLKDIKNLMDESTVSDQSSFASFTQSFSSLYTGGDFKVESSSLDGLSSDQAAALAEKTARSVSEGSGQDAAFKATAIIQAQKSSDLYKYQGKLTARFSFVPGSDSRDAGSWRLDSVEASPESFKKASVSLVGQWKGNFQSAKSSSFLNSSVSYAGKTNPLKMEVTSYDATSGKLVCNLSFTAHEIEKLSQSVEKAKGDEYVSKKDVIITLDPQTLAGSWDFKDPQGKYFAHLDLEPKDGILYATMQTGPGSGSSIFSGSYSDTYILQREK